MRLAGRLTVGGTPVVVAQDTKRVARFRMPQAGLIAKGSMYLDGLGGGGLGPEVCRQVIYDETDALVAVSDEVSVAVGQPGSWVDFSYSAYQGKLALPVGDFYAGIFADGYTNTIRVFGDVGHGMGGKWNADTYADGPATTFGSATAVTSDLSCYLTHFAPYASILPDETDLYFSRLPFADAQIALAGGGSLTGMLVDAGWHDTFIDPEMGANALVRDGSDLVDLLGERILITVQGVAVPRSVIAYVHNLADADAFDWDLSLTRHLFAQLGLLSADTLSVVVEVVS